MRTSHLQNRRRNILLDNLFPHKSRRLWLLFVVVVSSVVSFPFSLSLSTLSITPITHISWLKPGRVGRCADCGRWVCSFCDCVVVVRCCVYVCFTVSWWWSVACARWCVAWVFSGCLVGVVWCGVGACSIRTEIQGETKEKSSFDSCFQHHSRRFSSPRHDLKIFPGFFTTVVMACLFFLKSQKTSRRELAHVGADVGPMWALVDPLRHRRFCTITNGTLP